MNASPHTHHPKLVRENWDQRWILSYGDKSIDFVSELEFATWSQERLERELRDKLAEVVRRHDQGSIALAREDANRKRVATVLQEIDEQLTGSEGWPSHAWRDHSPLRVKRSLRGWITDRVFPRHLDP